MGNTKEYLENVFGHLRWETDSTKSDTMNHYRLHYAAATCAPALESVKPMVTVEEEDWNTPLIAPKYRLSEGMYQMSGYSVASSVDLSALIHGRGKPKWKSAGPEGDKRCVAAVRFLKADVEGDFATPHLAWMSKFLLKGQVYYELASEPFRLSLGFHGWCTVGWPLERIDYGGDVYLKHVTPIRYSQLVTMRQSRTLGHLDANQSINRYCILHVAYCMLYIA